ncbi:MAG TPA: FAD-dependent oxidoreductase [Candidatus Nanoarchaeia archaeon]|nr:FAD-dependent oxidoreductase [Candidatus Nanoarchaeia archaeon]
MKLQLIRRQPETHDTERFYFTPGEKFDYQPGQFLKWTINHEADERGQDRFFSLASSPTEAELMLCTKFAAEHPSTFKQQLKALTIGSVIEAIGPNGGFVLDESTLPVILVAGGIGITPFRSTLKFMHDSQVARPVRLLYSCRSAQDIVFKTEIDEWTSQHDWLTVSYVLEDTDGRLDAAKIEHLVGSLDGKQLYLSGPEPMIEALEKQLLEASIAEEQIKTDFFPGYTTI